jgi:serine/threonine protein kinase
MGVPQTEVIITKDGTELLRKTVPPGEYVIGRNPECSLRVQTELISRAHARLTINFQEVFIEDLGSSNGTFVAGQQIAECTRVFPGQPVKLGAASVELRRLKPDDPSESISPHGEALRRHLPADFLGPKKYTVGAVIAQGGMGAILEAEENALRRKLAMKRMLGTGSEDDLVRFIEEAQITSQLDHPNIVPVYELNLDEHEHLYYTMKLVRGITLHQVLSLILQGVEDTVKKYPLAALLGIFQKVCDALAFAHSKGVLHRDLKPDNIMLGEYGEVMVMDWGLARASGRRHGSGGPQRTLVRSARQEQGQATMVGLVFGTPQYMAPEQARGESNVFDARTDIYSLGAILYQILTLEPPIKGDDVGQMLLSVASGNVGQLPDTERGPKATPEGKNFPHLPGGQIPPALAAITRKAMALRQEDRYASVQEMQAAIEEFQQSGLSAGSSAAGAATSAMQKLLIALIVVLVAIIGALAVLLMKAKG